MSKVNQSLLVSRVRNKSKDFRNLQILFKEHWRLFNSGGQYLEYEYDRHGDGILRKALIDEIVPDKLFYFQQVWHKDEFYPVVFNPLVEWKTIKELQKYIWLEK